MPCLHENCNTVLKELKDVNVSTASQGDAEISSGAGAVKAVISPTQNGIKPISNHKSGEDSTKSSSHKSSKVDGEKHKHKEHKHKDSHIKSSNSSEKKEHKNHHSTNHKSKTKEGSSSSKVNHHGDVKHHSSAPKDSGDHAVKHKHDDKHASKPSSKEGEAVKHKHHDVSHKEHKHKEHKDHGQKSELKLVIKPEKSHKEVEKHKHSDKPKEKSSHSSEKHKTKCENHVKVEHASPLKEKQSHVKTSKVKDEPLSEDELPLAARKVQKEAKGVKRERLDESDDEPLSSRAEKVKKQKVKPEKKRKAEDEDFEPVKKVKKEKENKNIKSATKASTPNAAAGSPKKRGKQKEEPQDVWKWWEEEKREDGVKWKTLSHQGPVFAPVYERLPKKVHFYYDGKRMELSEETEEVAGFYARMLDHDYTTKDSFNKNFFKDWKKCMTSKEKEIITDLKKCNFKEIGDYYKMKSEERKAMTKEQKQEIKKLNEEQQSIFGFCIIDGHKQKIGNFKIEPPGLFRGRGEHPKMGMLKRRVKPEDVIINIGKESEPPKPPEGRKWKEVRHDNSVTWLVSWSENILGQTKYIMLNPSSKLKGEKDWQKYEIARKLKNHAARIRQQYEHDWKSKEMRIRQRSVALYFIDKLALRAGNEKEEGETADTVGCCSLRVEHIKLYSELNGKENVVEFDFLGKDSIRYVNSVSVEKRVFKNIKLFMENKQPGDDLFDRLNTSILNKYLNELMEGLTAKVFRTYNASKTLQEQLDLLTKSEMSLPEKLLAYNRANRAVAILCNHQRSVPKTFDKQMENLQKKIQEKEEQVKECKKDVKNLKKAAKGSSADRVLYEKKKKRLAQLQEQMMKLEVQATDKEENKQIALGTSKLNYLDPRISVAWCKKWEVPIEKIYNRTQRDKFLWAIEMAGPEFRF